MQFNTEGLELGQIVEDRVTGFTGCVTGFVAYITGCAQALVTPRMADAKATLIEARWVDVGRLHVVGTDPEAKKLVSAERAPANRGADVPAPVK